MNIHNIFDLLVTVFFAMSPQIGLIGPKYQGLVISFCLGKGETIPQSHLRYIQARSKIFMLNDETGQIKNLTGKYIM